MKILQRSNYLIFFDDVRVDQYVVSWNAANGLFANDAVANITMFRSDAMDNWKAYLTQVKIFGENPFTKKFTLLFDGEIMNRSWNQNRSNMGKVTFLAKGFYHWLDIQVPLAIQGTDEFDPLLRFIYEAQNINIDEVRTMITPNSEVLMKDKSIEEIINQLFEKLTVGYYDVAGNDTAFAFAKVKERFKVMVDVLPEFREAGFLDLFTFTKTSQIESFYVFLNEVLTQLMFEFYQDRDGSFRIKTPSWSDNVLKAHVIDSSIVSGISGLDDWEQEPTRVLAIGAETQYAATMKQRGMYTEDMLSHLSIPVGLYIGDPRSPESEEYYSSQLEHYLQNYGINPLGYGTGDTAAFSDSGWFDNTGNYAVNSKHRSENRTRPNHQGTDYNYVNEPVYSLGTIGTVTAAGNHLTMGNYVVVKQIINGEVYHFRYMHFSEPAHVKPGQQVAPGQQLGKSGATGRDVTGPHLHLEVWKGETGSGQDLNPENFLSAQRQMYQASSFKSSMGMGLQDIDKEISGSASKSSNYVVTSNSGVTAAQLNASLGGTLAGKGKQFVAAGVAQGIDPAFLAAVAMHETGNGTSDASKTKNNVGGMMKRSGGLMSFSSVEDGIDAMASNLKRLYVNDGLVTVDAIQKRYAPSGAANDPTGLNNNWVSGVNKFLSSFGVKSVSAGSGYLSTPYANVDNVNSITSTLNSLMRKDTSLFGAMKSSTNTSKSSDTSTNKDPVPVTYTSKDKAVVPSYSKELETVINNNSAGVSPKLVSSIIETTSGWRENNSSSGHIGLMGIPSNYAADVLAGQNLLEGTNSIKFGTDFLKSAMDRFGGKVSFALAAYYLGSLSEVEKITKMVGQLDFSKARDEFDAATLDFVDSVISSYTGKNGNFIKGDPHISFGTYRRPGGPQEVNEDGSPVIFDKVISESGEIPDYESSYKPRLSNEERKYKVNLKRVEQALIRADSPAIQGKSKMTADKLIYQFAKYNMQLHRARTHNINISLATCLPFIRPGFNAWIEPTRTDVMCYITGVTHQGSFQDGCTTNINGGFVRPPDNYRDVDASIFIGETRSTSSDFGEIVAEGEMKSLRSELNSMHEKSLVGEAQEFSLLNKLYSSMNGKNEFTTDWNQEFTVEEITKKIGTIFNSAPVVVQERKAETADAIKKSEDIFLEKLLFTKH